MNLDQHPSVRRFRQAAPTVKEPLGGRLLAASWLRQLALQAGADDAGCVGRCFPT